MKPLSLRVGIGALALVTGVVLLSSGCNNGAEGDRCILPNSSGGSYSHDSCNSGLSCQQPTDCPESYCCPIDGRSSNPYCQPGCAGGQDSICAAGGDADCPSEGGGDDGAASSGDAAGDAASDGGSGSTDAGPG
jgi:hypothetical protein